MKKLSRIIIKWTSVLLLLLVLSAAGGYIWLINASPALGFLDSHIRNFLKQAEPEYRITFGEVRFACTGWLLPGIEINDIVVVREEKILSRIPRIMVTARLFRLFSGEVEPVSLTVEEPSVFLPPGFRDAETGFSPCSGDMARQFMKSIDLFSEQSTKISSFRLLRIRNAEIFRGKYAGGQPLEIRDFKARIRHTDGKVSLKLDISVSQDQQNGAAEMRIITSGPDAPGQISGQLDNISPVMAGFFLPEPAAFLAGYDLPLQGRIQAQFDNSGFTGVEYFEISSTGGTISHPDIWPRPLTVKKLELTGSVTENPVRLNLTSFVADCNGPVFDLSGQVQCDGSGPDISLDGHVSHLDISEAHLYWPRNLARAARTWIRDHFSDGMVDRAEVKLRFSPEDFHQKPLPEKTIQTVIPFRNAALTYYDRVSGVKSLSGTARFSAHGAEISVDAGQIDDSSINRGTVNIFWVSDRGPYMNIEAETSGPADDIRKAADGLTHNPWPVPLSEGRADTRLSFEFPLRHLTPEDFHYEAVSEITDIVTRKFNNFTVSQKRLSLNLKNDSLTIAGTDTEVRNSQVLARPLRIRKIRGRGKILHNPPGFDIKSVEMSVDNTWFSASGVIRKPGKYPDIRLDVSADHLDAAQVLPYWPLSLAASARKWFGERMSAGNFDAPAAHIRIQPDDLEKKKLPGDVLDAVVLFRNVALDYYPPLPLLEKAAGKARFSMDGVRVDVSEGRILGSDIKTGNVKADGFRNAPVLLNIDASVNGPLADILEVEKRLDKAYNGPAFDGKTSAETRISLAFPLLAHIPADRFDLSASSLIHNLGISDLYGLKFTDGEFQAKLEGRNLTASGTLLAGRTSVDVNLKTQYSRTGEREEILDFSGLLQADRLSDFGLRPMPFLDGKARMRTTLHLKPNQTSFETGIDLKGMAVSLPGSGWIKPSEKKGNLRFSGQADKEKLRFSELRLDADSVDIRGKGEMSLGDKSSFSLQFNPLKIGGNDLNLDISGKSRHFQASVNGNQADAVPFLDTLAGKSRLPDKSSSDENQWAGDINIRLKKLRLKNNGTLQNLRVDAKCRGTVPVSGTLEGTLGSGQPVKAELGRQFILVSRDAGSLLKGTGLTPNFVSGELDLKAVPDLRQGSRSFKGNLAIRNCTVLDTPGLVRFLSAASLIGLVEQIKSGGIDFGSIDLDFEYRDRILHIKDGKAEGSSLGVTAEGEYDTNAGSIDLRGVVVPFNLFNKVIEVIPVLGKAIVGDGIIATSYHISGPYKEVNIDVNPLSTLALGGLKDIFRNFRMEKKPDGELWPHQNRESPK